MRVSRVGYAAAKGTRHLARERLVLAADGVVGDRRWCFVDVAARRVLRTVAHPGLVARLLRGHVKVDQVHQHLYVPLGLEVAAHDTERQKRPPTLCYESGDDRVKGTLVRLEPVGVFGIERKRLATVLHCETDTVRTDGGSEVRVNALD